MKTSEFLNLLKEHPNKGLLFEYTPDKLVGANYHITEVKNITVDAVDCGARTDFWKETIVQLWESPKDIDNTEYMTSYKALGILNKVDKMRTMDRNAEVKFEYSNPQFHTAQLSVHNVVIENKQLRLQLHAEATDCKAKDECGVPAEQAVSEEACCSPDSGCC
jgi:hypothetical protein